MTKNGECKIVDENAQTKKWTRTEAKDELTKANESSRHDQEEQIDEAESTCEDHNIKIKHAMNRQTSAQRESSASRSAGTGVSIAKMCTQEGKQKSSVPLLAYPEDQVNHDPEEMQN